LGGLVDSICPECGRQFSFFAPSTWTTLEDEATKATRDRHPPNRLMIVVSVVLGVWIVVASSGIAGPDVISVIILMLACPALMLIWFLRGLVAVISTAFRLFGPFPLGFSWLEAIAWIAVPCVLIASGVLAWSGLLRQCRWRLIDAPRFRAEVARLRTDWGLVGTWTPRYVGTISVHVVRANGAGIVFEIDSLFFYSDMVTITHTQPGDPMPVGENLSEGFTLQRLSM
jgi:hypothetical protein